MGRALGIRRYRQWPTTASVNAVKTHEVAMKPLWAICNSWPRKDVSSSPIMMCVSRDPDGFRATEVPEQRPPVDPSCTVS